jgi:hypothetical protein
MGEAESAGGCACRLAMLILDAPEDKLKTKQERETAMICG